MRHFKQKHKQFVVNADVHDEIPMQETSNKENATPIIGEKGLTTVLLLSITSIMNYLFKIQLDRIIAKMEDEVKALKQIITELQKNGTNTASDGYIHIDEDRILAEKGFIDF